MVVVNAFGLIVYFDGPHLGRGTDRTAFCDSQLRSRFRASLRDHLPQQAHQLSLLGDAIFVNFPPHILSLPAHFHYEFDQIDSNVRTCVEWCIGKLTQNWKFVDYQNAMKIMLFPVARDVVVAAILTNCLSLLQGNQTHLYFQDSVNNPYLLDMPTIEDYFGL